MGPCPPRLSWIPYLQPLLFEGSDLGYPLEMFVEMPELAFVLEGHGCDHEVRGRNHLSSPVEVETDAGRSLSHVPRDVKPMEGAEIGPKGLKGVGGRRPL